MALKAKIEWQVYEGSTLIGSTYEVTYRNTEKELRERIFSRCEKEYPSLSDAIVTDEDNQYATWGYWDIKAQTDTHLFKLTISNLN